MRLAWMIVLLDEAGPDEFGLDEAGWMSFNWMRCPVPVFVYTKLNSDKNRILR